MEPPSLEALSLEGPPWVDLPAEALQRVFELSASPVAVARAACACRAWRDAAADDATWRSLYGVTWGALAAGSPAATWRARCAGRTALPSSCLRALRDCASPLLRGDALQRCVALEAANPGAALRELQARLADEEHAKAADRALSELALAALQRVGSAPPDAGSEASTLLDAACAVALLIDTSADVAATRAAVARLGHAARQRLQPLDGEPLLARLDALNAFLFGAQHAGDAASSLLDADAPLPGQEADAGCGLGGQLDAYYAARNSSLTEMLRTRRGLPIILAVLHVVVADAAGVPLRPCGIPQQFMTRTAEEAPGEPQFVDVYGGGLRRSREEMLRFIGAMGIVPHENLLAPTVPREVAGRMIRNLLHLTDAGAAAGLRPTALLHLHTASLSLLPVTLDMRLQRFSHACDALDVHLMQQDYDALSAGEELSTLQPLHRRHLLLAMREQLDKAYEKAAAGSSE
jgi:regulator of sirC expression with transglutaminase-like and TPR domain